MNMSLHGARACDLCVSETIEVLIDKIELSNGLEPDFTSAVLLEKIKTLIDKEYSRRCECMRM